MSDRKLQLPGDEESDLRVELVLFSITIFGVAVAALSIF